MVRLALRSILDNRLRLGLTSLSIVLGVAFMSGTLIFTDTIDGVFEDLMFGMVEGQDVVVQAEEFYDVGLVDTPPFAASVLPDVAAVDGVESAEPTVGGFAVIHGPDGKAINSFASLGQNWMKDDRLAGNRIIRDGRPPVEPTEVAMDAYTAENNGFALGDIVTIQTVSGLDDYELVATVGFGDVDSVGGATFVMVEYEAARRIFGSGDEISSIVVLAEDGVSVGELVERVTAVLPDGVEALEATEVAARQSEGIREGLGFLRTGLLAFAAVAVLVAALIILNTFRIIVQQRERELALIRSIGATRGQILRMVLIESLVVALVATAVGIAAGFVVAWGLTRLMIAVGFDMPPVSFSLRGGTVLVCLGVGVGSALLAALNPARRASRIPPVAALRAAGTAPGSSRTRGWVGVLLLCIGIAVLLFALQGTVVDAAALTDLSMAVVGATLVLVGVSLLSVRTVGIVSRLLGRPAVLGVMALLAGVLLVLAGIGMMRSMVTLLPIGAASAVAGVLVVRLALSAVHDGFTARLAAQNTRNNASRAATSASALMIGVALVTLLLILGDSIKASAGASIAPGLRAQFVITASGFTGGVSPELATSLRDRPGVVGVTSFRPGYWDLEGAQQTLVALDARGGSETLDIDLAGSEWPALREGVFVYKGTAERNDWQVGDTVPMGFAKTGLVQMPITGIYQERNIVQSDYLLDLGVFSQHFVGFTTDADSTILVAVDPSLTPEAGRAIVDSAAADYANATVLDHDEYLASRMAQIDMGTAAFTLLIGFAVFIATIGVANTLALAVHERMKEIGLLRAVGMTRGQLHRLVTWEALVVALVGSLLGVAIGVLFGVAIASAMATQGVAAISIPVVLLLVVTLCGAVAGLAAAIIPARIAARTSVLEAIAHE